MYGTGLILSAEKLGSDIINNPNTDSLHSSIFNLSDYIEILAM